MSFFSVDNHHVDTCGQPPNFTDADRDKQEYRSYFEGSNGDQWVFSANRVTKKVSVYGGDCDWTNEMTVKVIKLSMLGQFLEKLSPNDIQKVGMLVSMVIGPLAAPPVRVNDLMGMLAKTDNGRRPISKELSQLNVG